MVPPSNCTPPDALVLEKPLPDDALRIVAKGEKEDGPEVEVKSNCSSGYSLRFAGFPCCPPLSTTLRFLNDTTVPGTRLLALIRRRPVPVNT
jgi:hypothetical protein